MFRLQYKYIFLLLFIILVLLFAEGFILLQNKRETKEDKNVTSLAELTPEPGLEEGDSSWEGKKTSLFKGVVPNTIDKNNREINLIQKDNNTKVIMLSDNTVYLYIYTTEDQLSDPSSKKIDASVFWGDLEEGEEISASCYENGEAVFITKMITVAQ